MQRYGIRLIGLATLLALSPATGSAQHAHDVTLHVNPRWDECSFQLDPALTQGAWRQFTKEAGVVTHFRPLRGARPLGVGSFEVSILQTTTGIDDHDAAWNDTFVHPDSTHWLFEGSGLPIPGLMARVGVTGQLDVGAYFTQNPNANYGFWGGQAQYNVLDEATSPVSVSARVSLVSMFGPEDLDFTTYGTDVVASRDFRVHSTWLSITPYVGVTGSVARAHEKTGLVALRDENVAGVQAMFGAVAQIAAARVAFEYDAAAVRSHSIRIGVAF